MKPTLQAKTLRDFAKYVATVEARRAREITNNEPFLDIERQPAAQLAQTMAALKRGEVIVTRGAARDGSSNEIAIDGGLVNHWRGTVFVPNVQLDALLKVLQEPQTDKHKQEDVLSSRVVSRDGDSQKVYLRLRRTKFVTVVYDTEYDVDYKRLAHDRALSNSISTKVVEIENAGTPRERALPEGNDHGYMWKLNSYWRYKQFDGGVLVEIESLTLSRDLPAIIGPLIRPIVTSTARESMTRTLASVRARFANYLAGGGEAARQVGAAPRSCRGCPIGAAHDADIHRRRLHQFGAARRQQRLLPLRNKYPAGAVFGDHRERRCDVLRSIDGDPGRDPGYRHGAINDTRGSREVHRLRRTRSLLVDAEEEVSLLRVGDLAVHRRGVAHGLERDGRPQRLVRGLSRQHVRAGTDEHHHARKELHA